MLHVRNTLAFIGRHATTFMAAGVLVGLAVPPLAALARPLLVPALVIPLGLALLRLDWHALAEWRQRARTSVLLIVWVLGVCPVIVWAVASALVPFGLPAPLREALVLMGASSPLVTSVAIALIVGLDATLAVVVVLVATALVPFTLPLLAQALVGITLQMGIGLFMLRLGSLVGGAFAMAWLIRRLVTPSTLSRHRELLDGLTVVNLVLFAIAVMDGVTAYALTAPRYVAIAVAAAFGFNLLLQAIGYLAFVRLGARGALTAALVSGNCNLGLVLVALEGRASFEVTVFFALAQIPMYTLPALLMPVYRRLLPSPPATSANSR